MEGTQGDTIFDACKDAFFTLNGHRYPFSIGCTFSNAMLMNRLPRTVGKQRQNLRQHTLNNRQFAVLQRGTVAIRDRTARTLAPRHVACEWLSENIGVEFDIGDWYGALHLLRISDCSTDCKLHNVSHSMQHVFCVLNSSNTTIPELVDISVLVPIAHGTEELEAVAIIDIARRAGFRVRVAGESDNIICSRGVRIAPDCCWSDLHETELFDAIVLPGGSEGVERFLQSEDLEHFVRRHAAEGSLLGAICAAPLALHHFGVLPPSCALTSHPSVADQLRQYDYRPDRVVESGRIITSRGAGTAVEFALAIVSALAGVEHARRIAEHIVAV